MNANEDSPKAASPLRRRVFGSALSAFVGWFALNLFVLAYSFVTRAEHRSSPPMPNEWLVGPYFVGILSAIFVFATWFVALLPLYLFVPLRSWLWRWPLCTAGGALAGALIMLAYYAPHPYDTSRIPMTILAAFTGAITCLFGALTAKRFHHASSATNVA